MPVRATKRGAERTPFPPDARYDVVICGASFAGLAVARELRGLARACSGARPLRDRRASDVGVLRAHGMAGEPRVWRARSGRPSTRWSCTRVGASIRWTLPYTFSTFDYRELCGLLWAQCGDAEFETAKVDGRTGDTIHTDRGDVTAPLIVDALGWRRVLVQRGGDPAARGHALARSRGPSARFGSRPPAVGRSPLCALGLRVVVPGRRRAADRDRLIRTSLPRKGADGASRRRRGGRHRRLPGQLDPAPDPPGDRGRRVLRGRLRRALPAR